MLIGNPARMKSEMIDMTGVALALARYSFGVRNLLAWEMMTLWT